MLHEPCLGNSIASAQGTIISLRPDSNDGGLQFGFFLPGVTRVLSRVSVAQQVNCHFFPTPYGTPPLTGRLYLKSEEWAE